MNDDILESSVKVIEYTGSEVSAEKQLMCKSKLPYVKNFFLPGILAVSWVFQNLHGFPSLQNLGEKKALHFAEFSQNDGKMRAFTSLVPRLPPARGLHATKYLFPGLLGTLAIGKCFCLVSSLSSP